MANYGTYGTPAELKSRLKRTDTTEDTRLRQLLERVSRWADKHCYRHFQPRTETRYFTPTRSDQLTVDDLLSVTTLKTDEDDDYDYDYTWDGTVTTGDYLLYPYNIYPKWKILLHPNGDYTFPTSQIRSVEIAGLWGYGNGESATPYTASGCTITVATTTGTTVVPSDQSLLAVGQCILCGTEQMYITSLTDGGVGADSGTVVRGVNGTTAAVQAAVAAYIYQYPDDLVEAVMMRAEQLWMLRQGPGGAIGGSEMGMPTSVPAWPAILDLLSDLRRREAV